ncbi:PREDICTED: sideroflexin-1-like [Priapulus caudatus]|uniref:Sidoreflexin n=1 Tax=Priapulus caudatus TaxID=37621 RepID=A0ABM1E004_PRICU|nr:PREDICTED: sideroflexin-1-like [Priapulus caudatus]
MDVVHVVNRINLDKPSWDQTTFSGRAKHFIMLTNPLNVLCTNQQLDEAKNLIYKYKKGEEPPGTTPEQLWQAKYAYDSAFHPDTGEKMMLIGRMSAQVPMNMSITGLMMTFYKTTPAVIFWQWINQSFNALVNYTNRSGDTPIPNKTLAMAYVGATTGATLTGLFLNSAVKNAPALVGRFVPFAAVAAANCINIPLMRFSELTDGIPVFDENGNRIGDSVKAAERAIPMVLLSRIMMASPGMVIPAIVINKMEGGKLFRRFPWAVAPVQVMLVGACLVFATPLCCAIFPQNSSINVSSLEPALQEKVAKWDNPPTTAYYNKGL